MESWASNHLSQLQDDIILPLVWDDSSAGLNSYIVWLKPEQVKV